MVSCRSCSFPVRRNAAVLGFLIAGLLVSCASSASITWELNACRRRRAFSSHLKSPVEISLPQFANELSHLIFSITSWFRDIPSTMVRRLATLRARCNFPLEVTRGTLSCRPERIPKRVSRRPSDPLLLPSHCDFTAIRHCDHYRW